MAIWLNIKGQNAEACTSMADGIEKFLGMLGIRLEDALCPLIHIAVGPNGHYRITISANRTEEFWLSPEPESKASE